MLRSCRALALAALLGVVSAGPAAAGGLLDRGFWMSGPEYTGVLPACEDPMVLGRIARRFAERERKFWQSELTILGFDQVRETAYRPWARGAPDAIPRRYCSGLARVSDARTRPVHFWIGEDTGWLGASWGIEWCIVGLDRNWAYNPGCRMARP